MKKIDSKELIKKVKAFVLKHHIILILIFVVVGGVLAFTGMVWYNQTSSFCQECHKNRGTYFSLDLQIPAHQKINQGGPSCLTCHTDKALEMQMFRSVKKIPKYSERVANLRIENQVNSKDIYKDESCLECHPEILELEVVDEPNLPFQLQEIGLRFSHKTHHRFVHFSAEDEELWKQLKLKPELTQQEADELALLERIRLGNCETCHSQSKLDEKGNQFVDKTVNYTARNPIGCNGCHEGVNPGVHPGNDLEFPKKEACYKCHHGKLHGKFVIFLADCEGKQGKENCIKCHPQYVERAADEMVNR